MNEHIQIVMSIYTYLTLYIYSVCCSFERLSVYERLLPFIPFYFNFSVKHCMNSSLWRTCIFDIPILGDWSFSMPTHRRR